MDLDRSNGIFMKKFDPGILHPLHPKIKHYYAYDLKINANKAIRYNTNINNILELIFD